MNTEQLIGDVSFTEQPPEIDAQPGVSTRVTRTWTGARDQLVEFLVTRFPIGGANLSIRQEGSQATVKATYGYDPNNPNTPPDPLSRVWKLDGNDIEITPFALPQVQIELAKITDATKRALVVADIRALVDGQREIEVVDDHGNRDTIQLTANLIVDAVVADWPAVNKTVLLGLIDAMASGIDSFPVSQYVLRKTETVVPSITGLHAQHDYVGKILSYAALLDVEPTLAFDPTALLIDFLGLNDPTEPTFWLKRRPVTDPVVGGHWQIVQEYWAFKTFSKFVYGAPIL